MKTNLQNRWRPEREVEIVAGTAPGGGQDRPARALVRVLERTGLVDVPFRIKNVPGLGGRNAWHYLLERSADPHVVAINSPTIISNHLLGLDPLDFESLTPIANLYTEYIIFVVRSDSAIGTAGDLIERLGSDAGAIKVGLATAIGNTNHIALAEVTRHAGGNVEALDLKVFDSARQVVADVLKKGVALGAITAASAVPELGDGTLRALAISSPQRQPGPLGRVPTWTELGVPCATGTWRGLIGAPGLSAQEVAFWDEALGTAAAGGEWNTELAAHYWSNTYLDSKTVLEFLRREREAMRGALTAIGLL